MHSAIAVIERTKSANRLTLYLGHSAAAHASLGQPEVNLDLLDEAIQTADKINERFLAERRLCRSENDALDLVQK